MVSIKLAASMALLSLVSALQINTPPSLLTCQPALIQWSEGTGPFFVAILPGGQTGATPLVNFGQQTGNSLTWTVNLAVGTSISLQVTDSTGVIAYSSPVTVQTGASTDCVGGTAEVSANGSTTVASSGTGSVSTPAGTTTTTISSAASSAPGSSSSSASAGPASSRPASSSSSAAPPTSSSQSSGALPVAKIGFAGLASVAIAAVCFA